MYRSAPYDPQTAPVGPPDEEYGQDFQERSDPGHPPLGTPPHYLLRIVAC